MGILRLNRFLESHLGPFFRLFCLNLSRPVDETLGLGRIVLFRV